MVKKICSSLILICMLLQFASVNAQPANDGEKATEEALVQKLGANSPHAILVDLKTGMTLYKKKANEKVFPAGLTKIMTAVLALEKGNLETVVTASEASIANVKNGDSKMGIVKDERLSLRQLLYGMMLVSAADAANVVSEHIGGSIEGFVAMMNEKAKELGMKNTSFTNPVGTHDERHYTTASDMAKLALYAMKIPEFCEIVKSEIYIIPATEKYKNERKLTNRNYFVSRLLRREYYYKYATGIQTGYTNEAKSCIAASAKKNDMELLALVFEASTENETVMSFVDCKNMFEYVFSNYVPKTIVSENSIVSQIKLDNSRRNKKVTLKTAGGLVALQHKEKEAPEVTFKDKGKKSVSAPVKEGTVLGRREYFIDGTSVGSVDLVADMDYRFDPITFLVNKIVAFVISPWIYVAVIICLISWVLIERKRRKMLRKKRIEQRKLRNKELVKQFDYK